MTLRKVFSLIGIAVLLSGLFGTIIITRQNQDNRSRASTTEGTAYGTGAYGGAVFGTSPQVTETTQQPTIVNTVAPTTNGMVVSLSLVLDPIGKNGNKNPLHTQRTAQVYIYNSSNQLLSSTSTTVTYNADSYTFTGIANLGSNIQTGAYSIKIKLDQYLRTLVPGIQNLISGQTNQLAPSILIPGDIDGNNRIDIADYNILMGCYSDLEKAKDCSDSNSILTDLNDDGNVNYYDYNLFLRTMQNKQGE